MAMMPARSVPSNVGSSGECCGIRLRNRWTDVMADAETKAIDALTIYLNRVSVLSALQNSASRTLPFAMRVLINLIGFFM